MSVNLYAQDEQAPSMELLEFLGEELTLEDEVIDPLLWQETEAFPELDAPRLDAPRLDTDTKRNKHDD